MKVLLFLTTLLALGGCQGMMIEDWQLKYKNCKWHEHQDAVAITCKWKHSGLGT